MSSVTRWRVFEERGERSPEELATQAAVAVENVQFSYQAQQEFEARRQAEAEQAEAEQAAFLSGSGCGYRGR